MIAKLLFFLINFALAGSHFPTSSSSILETFNRNILVGDINALQSLIEANSKYITNPSAMQYRDSGFLVAVQEGHTPVVDLLLKTANVNAGAKHNEAIRMASENGNLDIVKLLLARPEVDPGAIENEALISAAKNGHTEIVRLLLEHPKVDPTIGGDHASFWASYMNHGDIVKLLISDERAYPSIIKIHTIQEAARFGDVELVRFLLEYPTFNRLARIVFRIDGLESIKTLVEAGYKFDQETLKRTLQRVRLTGNEDFVKYLESLKEPSKLPDRPLIHMTDRCAICLSNENLMEGYMTSCQHQFHVGCLQSWIAKHNSCPMCRSSIL